MTPDEPIRRADRRTGLPTRGNPWTRLASQTVYENPWIRVREDRVVRPDGETGIYGVVGTRIATGVVALTDADEVVLVGQWRYPLDRYSWEIVEGGVDDGETIQEAIARELREEAGLTAAVWEPLGDVVHLSNCFSSEEAYLFVARDLTEVPAAPEGTEDLARRRVPVDVALELVDQGEITDAMSVIGLLRLDRWRRGAPLGSMTTPTGSNTHG